MNLLAELRRRWLLVVFGLLVTLAVIGPRLAGFYTDVLWFQSIGFADVFWNLLWTRFGLGVVTGLVMAILVGANIFLARRLAPDFRIPSPAEEIIERYRQLITPVARPLMLALAAGTGILSGASMVSQWRVYLLWANGGSFDRVDPHFGRDLGFFVFDLPFYSMINSWLFGALAITIIITGGVHYLFGGIRPQAPGQKITAQANVHISVLLAALIAVRAWGFWLDRFDLSFSERGLVTGLSYTDVNAELRGLTLLTFIALVCVALFLANIRYRGWILPSAGVGILVVAALVLGGVYPAAIQTLRVDPQELPREREFIERNLAETRWAWGIDEEHVTYEDFQPEVDISRQEVLDNATTLEAIRLWDPATLQNSYQQLQELRPFYDFQDVDVDRYTIEGEPLQVMIAAREINTAQLETPSWQNEHILFTHGYGIVASTVSTAAADGQPDFVARDIPNVGVEELELEQPRIYFGEDPPDYSIINTTEDEFDFDDAQQQFFNRYDGEDGVNIGSPLNRAAFALRFAEPNILLSGLIQSDSRVLFNRSIRERVQEIAPFLELDHDPYPVVSEGRIVWIQDAYTVTDQIPYSQRVLLEEEIQIQERRVAPALQANGQVDLVEQIVRFTPLRGQANYIRNSVKVVIDAYDGTVTLYVNEPDDPLIQAWDSAFPDVLTPMSEVPEDIRQHFRYPEDMFRVQSRLLNNYHIPDADGFYNASDVWELPIDLGFLNNNSPEAGSRRDFPPTYQLIRLPGADEEDFSLIQPFTPVERQVLSAYVAAAGDPDEVGQLRVLQMPPTETVFGPEQVFARINQDPDVSQLITLLDDSGSQVLFGNLIVVPIEDSLLYAQPLFLRSEQSDIPELEKVVLVYNDQVVLEDRLDDALESLFGDLPDVLDDVPSVGPDGETVDAGEDPDGDDVGDAPSGDAIEVDADVQTLIAQAIEAFAEADAALARGDLGTYQERVQEAEALLERIQAALGVEVDVGQPSEEPESPDDDSSDAAADEDATTDGGIIIDPDAAPTTQPE